MCGFVFTSSLETFGGTECVRRALDVLERRGPDDMGIVNSAAFGLGHRRLTVIGGSDSGRQPVERDGHALVYNGEIYNYKEIATELGIRARSDTDVVFEIARLGKWSWLSRFRGMYAFVHVDTRAEVITAARDPFGIKPLFALKHANGEWSFASSVAALAESHEPMGPDVCALVGFLAEGLIPAGRSAFERVEKLPPGEIVQLTKERGSWRSSRFPVHLGQWDLLLVSDALRDSVRAHLVSDVEVGVLMSGGVDSTLIGALAAHEVSRIKTFTLVNPRDPNIDEAEFARANAAAMGATHLEVPVDPGILAKYARPLVEFCGEPFGDAAYLPLAALSEVVAGQVKVVLAGEGADELFGGYRRYTVERLFERAALRKSMGVVGKLRPWAAPAPKSNQILRVIQAASLPLAADRHSDLMFGRWKQVGRVFGSTAEIAHELFYRRWDASSGSEWSLGMAKNRAYDLREWLPNVFLEKSDRASMFAGLEVRTPFLDPVVALASARESPEDTLKRPLRDELFKLLPAVSLPRKKLGLGVNLSGVLGAGLNETARSVVYDQYSVLRDAGMLEPAVLDRLAASDPELMFRLAMIGEWQEAFL